MNHRPKMDSLHSLNKIEVLLPINRFQNDK